VVCHPPNERLSSTHLTEVDHHHTVVLVYHHLTRVFVFMLFSLTSLWKLPTFSGEHGRDGVSSLVGPGARCFVRGRAQKASARGIPQWGQLVAIPSHAAHVCPCTALRL
jgi:hypothetical protein